MDFFCRQWGKTVAVLFVFCKTIQLYLSRSRIYCVWEEETTISAGSSLAKLANSSKAVSQNDPSLLQALRLYAQTPAMPPRLYKLIRLCGQWCSGVSSERRVMFSSLFLVVLQRFQIGLKPVATTLVKKVRGKKNGVILRNNKMSAGSFKLNPVWSNGSK